MNEQDEGQSDTDEDEHANSETDEACLVVSDLSNPHVTNMGHDLVDFESTSLLNDADHLNDIEQASQFEFSGDAEEELYFRRLEEGYNLTDQTYDSWLNIHHTDLNKSRHSTVDTVSDIDAMAPSPIVGSSNITPMPMNSPAVLSATIWSPPTTHCDQATHKNMITPVRQMFQSNPTKLKLDDSTYKPPTPVSHTPTFSAEEETLYARRFDEGYDLPDPRYKAWLDIHHPDADNVSDDMAILPIVGLHVSLNVPYSAKL